MTGDPIVILPLPDLAVRLRAVENDLRNEKTRSDYYQDKAASWQTIIEAAVALLDGRDEDVHITGGADGHPESQQSVFVQDRLNPGVWKRVKIGFDPDTARLLDALRARAQGSKDA